MFETKYDLYIYCRKLCSKWTAKISDNSGMGSCCFWIPLLDGIIIHGFLNLIIYALGFFLTFYAESSLNPFYYFYNHTSDVLKELAPSKLGINSDTIDILINIAPTISLVGIIIYGLSCLLMMLGSQLKNHNLMIPYLVAQMVVVVSTVIIGIPLAAAMFYLDHCTDGQTISAFVVINSITSLYFWSTVKRAYEKLKNIELQDGTFTVEEPKPRANKPVTYRQGIC